MPRERERGEMPRARARAREREREREKERSERGEGGRVDECTGLTVLDPSSQESLRRLPSTVVFVCYLPTLYLC